MNAKSFTAQKRLQWLLYLMALHSFAVGVGLMAQIKMLMQFMGFASIAQPFFPAQGGIFHVIMAAAYFLAAKNRQKYECLIPFSIFVKSCATLFLFIYFFAVQPIPLILLSAVGDGLMALLLLLFYRSDRKVKLKTAK